MDENSTSSRGREEAGLPGCQAARFECLARFQLKLSSPKHHGRPDCKGWWTACPGEGSFGREELTMADLETRIPMRWFRRKCFLSLFFRQSWWEENGCCCRDASILSIYRLLERSSEALWCDYSPLSPFFSLLPSCLCLLSLCFCSSHPSGVNQLIILFVFPEAASGGEQEPYSDRSHTIILRDRWTRPKLYSHQYNISYFIPDLLKLSY